MKIMFKIFVCIIFLFLAKIVCADTMVNYNSAHFELTAQTGLGGVDTPAINAYNANGLAHVENSRLQQGVSWRVAGAWMFDANPKFIWGPEFGYAQVSTNKYFVTTTSVSNETAQVSWSSEYFDFLLSTRYQVAPNINLLCKVGIGNILQQVNILPSGADPAIKNRDASFAPEFVLGAGYNLTQHLLVNFTYNIVAADHIDTTYNTVLNNDDQGNDASKVAKIETYQLGVTYLF